jgi:serine/threonine-protein kinase
VRDAEASDDARHHAAERFAAAQELFMRVVELPPDEQTRQLIEHAHDAALVEDVRQLLAADVAGIALLDRPLDLLAAALIEPADAHEGRRIGPYQLGEVLGEGGMGVVYLAHRDDVARPVALKIILDGGLSPSRRARFLTERFALSSLLHPRVAQLYDAGTLDDGTPWFAMEYVRGMPLDVYCRDRALSVRDTLALLAQVCEAVQHAHEHAIVHRDLKPSNILVTETGEVKLLDFGIAKLLEPVTADGAPNVDALVTRSEFRLMTPAYAAPEQIRGAAIGVYTDVYALGVLTYQLVTGVLPFDLSEVTPHEAFTRIVEQDAERASVAAARHRTRAAQALGESAHDAPARAAHTASPSKAMWADLDLLCSAAMHKDPSRRYRTVDALHRDLVHTMRGEPLDAHPDSVPYRLSRFVRRNRRAVVAGALTVLLLSLVGVGYVTRIAAARDAATAEARRRDQLQQFLLSLFSGDKAGAPAETLRVSTLVERGERQAAMLGRDPAAQGDLYVALGSIHEALGRFDRADSVLREGVRALETAGDADAQVLAWSSIAEVRLAQARYDGADSALQQANRLLAGARPPARARVLEMTGRRQVEQGHYDSATITLAAALTALPGDSSQHLARASIVSALADAAFYDGALDRADSLNDRALALYRGELGDRHPRVAGILLNLGASQFDRGNYGPAEQRYREGLSLLEGYFGASHVETASAHTKLGRALVAQERFEEATYELQRALAVQLAALGPAHPSIASAFNELGNIAIKRKALDTADTYFVRMADVYRRANGDAHFTVAVALSNRGTVAMERGDLPRAEGVYRDVVQRFTRAQGADHLNTGIARIKLGRSLIRQHRWREGIAESEAGYHVVAARAAPGVSFLQAARRDLAIAYDSIGQSAVAARFRDEARRNDPKPAK